MRRRTLVCLVSVVALATACDDAPTAPETDGLSAAPSFAAVYGRDVAIRRIVELQPPPGIDFSEPGFVYSLGDVNEVGQVVAGHDGRGILWDESGAPTELPLLPGAATAAPRAINDAGQIVGWVDFGDYTRAVLWEDGRAIDLGTLPGYQSSVANDVSESGDIVGTASGGGEQPRGFTYRNGVMTPLEPSPGDEATRASYVNSSGVVLGVSRSVYSEADPDESDRLVVWQDGELAHVLSFSTFDHGWVGLDEAGNGYVNEHDTGLITWVVRDGQVSMFFTEEYGNPAVNVSDVSPDGLLTGGTGTWRADPPDDEFGVWVDGVFHEIAYPGNPRCRALGDAAQVLCFPDDRDAPMVAYLDLGQATMEDGVASVTDLSAISVTATAITLRWTQVDDGTGQPAWYRVKYVESPLLDWSAATVGCDRTIVGDEIGRSMECTVEGLAPETEYELQMVSFRSEDGYWVDAAYSNIVRRSTGRDRGELTDVVDDLEIVDISDAGASFRWTQVDDGTGEPAWYRLKLAEAPIRYGDADVVCTLEGDQIGSEATCAFDGPLLPGTTYEARLVSYRLEEDRWMGNVFSNIAAASTDTAAVGMVDDLRVTDVGYGLFGGNVSLRWTAVDNGVGEHAFYRVRYAAPVGEWENWKEGELGCDLEGFNSIGSTMGCSVSGLSKGIHYEFQLMSYRTEDGRWVDATYSNKARVYIEPDSAPRVEDLRIVDQTSTSLTVAWTEINDGSIEGENHPASYRVKYSPDAMSDWSSASIGCDPAIDGEYVGGELRCTITGLDPDTYYEVQLMSYWVEDGRWQGAQYSNIDGGSTAP